MIASGLAGGHLVIEYKTDNKYVRNIYSNSSCYVMINKIIMFS